jgi:hypothetical protein
MRADILTDKNTEPRDYADFLGAEKRSRLHRQGRWHKVSKVSSQKKTPERCRSGVREMDCEV